MSFEKSVELDVAASVTEVFDVLSHVPTSAGFFPRVDRLVDLGDHCYRWELHGVGPSPLNLRTVYAARYRSDRRLGTVAWTALPGHGNAQVDGRWTLAPRRRSTHLRLEVHGRITLPLPGLTRRFVGPIVARENEKLIETYVANLARRFGDAG